MFFASVMWSIQGIEKRVKKLVSAWGVARSAWDESFGVKICYHDRLVR